MSFKLLILLSMLPFLEAASPNRTITAEEGDDVFLQCLLNDQHNISSSTVDWIKDIRKNIVHLFKHGRDFAGDQKEEFKGRTDLFHDGLSRGNVTLKLSNVRLSDSGTYRCTVRKPITYCNIVLNVVKRGQLNRSQGNDSNTPLPPLENKPKSDGPDAGNHFTCLSIIYTGFAIFCVAVCGLTIVILGTIWIYKMIQGRWRKAAEVTTSAEMQNLETRGGGGGGGGGGGEVLSRAAENVWGNIQQQVE